MVLGALDLDDFVTTNLKELSDWEKNFKALKARGRDAEKLPRYGKGLSNRFMQMAEIYIIYHTYGDMKIG